MFSKTAESQEKPGGPCTMRAVRDETEDFEFIINLVYERSRIRLHDGKHQLIRARLGKRMRLLGIEHLGDYCDFVRSPEGGDELTHVIDALTTNFTQFLREKDHFDFMVSTALPTVLPGGQKRFRVWSAACSTGEEPYSIAFYLAQHFPAASGWDWKIMATDISTKALAKGSEAIYPDERMAGLPPDWQRAYFQKGSGKWDGHFRVKDGVRSRVEFRQLNLLGQYPFNEPFQVIFCRNVMIYFDRKTQEELVRSLGRLLVPKGYLLIGHSESLTGLNTGMKCLRPSIYQKE
jgi:chemotaxis protein methyltransferase CheR